MGEGQPRRVEEVAVEPREQRTAVELVSHKRMSDEGEVGADLVHHAGGDLDLQQREAATPLERLEARHRRAGRVLRGVVRIADGRHPPRVFRVVRERQRDLAAGVDLSRHQRQISLLHRAGGELRAQQCVGGGGPRRQQQPRGVGVEPVDEAAFAQLRRCQAFALLRPELGQFGKAAHQRVGGGAGLAGLERMRRHPRRLVGDDDVLVGVHDADGQLGLRRRLIGRRLLDRDLRPRLHGRALGSALAVDAHTAVGDPVHRPPARDAEEPRHHLVEAVRGGSLGDLPLVELDHESAARR